jgi:hypothetical protein
MVKVLVKEGYNEIAFQFPAVVSAGAFMECLAMSSEKELVFKVIFEADKQEEPKSRFIDPDELKEIPPEELASVEGYL